MNGWTVSSTMKKYFSTHFACIVGELKLETVPVQTLMLVSL